MRYILIIGILVFFIAVDVFAIVIVIIIVIVIVIFIAGSKVIIHEYRIISPSRCSCRSIGRSDDANMFYGRTMTSR